MARVGRKPKHYITPTGETINGLSLRKKRGRKVFLPTGRDSPEFGSEDDPSSAIHRFRIWQARQNGEIEPLDPDPIQFGLDSHNQEYWRVYYRNLIYSDPRQAAIELDCEPLNLLVNAANLKPPTTVSLIELGQCYLTDNKGKINPDNLRNSETWWTQFCEIVGVNSVIDLSHDAFKKYRSDIERQCKTGKHANEWIRSRFGKVKTIIKHALAELDLSETDRRRLDHVALLKLPRKKKTPAVDITPKEMKTILAHADPLETALILLALNAAYLPSDLHALRWDMVDLKKKFIRFDREKSERLTKDAQPVPRCCVLWPRTIAALKKIRIDSDNVFISSRGKPIHVNTIVKRFRALVKKAKIKPRKIKRESIPVTFKHIRKSSLTAASNAPNVPDRQLDLLGGHSSGIKDVYVVPRNVALACEAIERYYFD